MALTLMFFSNSLFSTEFNMHFSTPFLIPSLNHNVENLDPDESSWLTNNETIKVGLVQPSHPPFEIFTNTSQFEGISADLLNILSYNTGVGIELISFSSAEQAAQSLERGDISMLSLGSWLQLDPNGPSVGLQSHKILKSVPVFFARREREDLLSSIRSGAITIAIPKNFVSPGLVRKSYPNAKIFSFDSTIDAFDAVYFGKADLLLADAYAGHYLNGERFSELTFLSNADVLTPDYHFIISDKHKPLLKIINRMIDELNTFGLYLVLSRWQGALNAVERSHINLSESERAFLQSKGAFVVGIVDGYVPYSLRGHEKKYTGITIDILDNITKKTGIQFKVVPYSSQQKLKDELLSGNIDIIGTYHNDDANLIASTVSYNRDDIIVLSGYDLNANSENVNRIALPNALSVFMKEIKRSYPKSDFIWTKDSISAYDKINIGEADAVISSLYQFKYQKNSNKKFKKIKVFSTILGINKIEVSFGVSINNINTLSVLNKALLQLSPSEMSRIAYQWRSNPLPKLSFIERNENNLLIVFIAIVVLLVVYITRYLFLRNEVGRRIEVEAELKESVAFNESLFNKLPHPLSVRDISGKLLFCNRYYADFFAVEMKDIIGKTISESFGDRIRFSRKHEDLVSKVIGCNKEIISDMTVFLDGDEFEIYQWVIPFHDVDGHVKGTIGGWIDVTERKLLAEKLIKSKTQAEAASRAKGLFLATMSHEIRTPMNAIIGFLEIFIDEHHNDVIDISGLKIAYDASIGLLDLIGDILDISKIESGSVELICQPYHISAVIDSVVNVLSPVAKNNLTNLDVEKKFSEKLVLHIDVTRMKQIMFNVLSNAIKFTKGGNVNFLIDYVDGSLDFIVEDNGIGIPSHKLPNIFQPFTRLHSDMVDFSGTGLGLSITQSLCNIMGGSISIESQEGVGTKVSISIPLPLVHQYQFSQESSRIDEPVFDLSGYNILIVDDNSANLKLLAMQIEHLGGNATISFSGDDAIDKYFKGNFDVVLTDCQMPGMDGFELTRELRFVEGRYKTKGLIIIGMTASALADDKIKGIFSGMNDCLFKPITKSILYSTLCKFISPSVQYVDFNSPLLDSKTMAANEDFVRVLLESNRNDVFLLKKAFADGNLEDVRQLAHRIRGGVDIIGDLPIHNLTKNIEQSILLSSHDREHLTLMINELELLVLAFNKKISF
jgi:two-component system sensor histidine kinase EvgS